MRLRWVLAFTAVTALGTGVLVYWLLMAMVAPGVVVITTASVSERTVLTRDMLMAVRVPRAAIHPEAIRRIEDALGRSPMYPLAAGEQILGSKLVEGALAGRLSGQLTMGERAMLIPLTADRAVGGSIGAHDRIDVIFVANSSKLGYQLTKTILSNVEVLDIRLSKGTSVAGGQGDGVIVRVTPAAAEELSFAISNGDLYVTLAGQGGATASAAGDQR